MHLPLTLPISLLALFLAWQPLLVAGASPATPQPAATPATPAGTPVPFAVTLEAPNDPWPAACPPAAVADTVRRFIDALNHVDAAALTALVPDQAIPIEVAREPGVFIGFSMPLPSGISGGASNRDEIMEYARTLEEGGEIVLTALTLSIQALWYTDDAGEPVVHLSLGPRGQVEAAGSEPVRFSGKGAVECTDPLQIVLWQAAPLPESAPTPRL